MMFRTNRPVSLSLSIHALRDLFACWVFRVFSTSEVGLRHFEHWMDMAISVSGLSTAYTVF